MRQQRSVALAVAPLVHDGIKINLIDTPGYGDFVGELRAGLRAADAALFVVPADARAARARSTPATVAQWEECAAVGHARARSSSPAATTPRADVESHASRPARTRSAPASPRCYLPIRDARTAHDRALRPALPDARRTRPRTAPRTPAPR